MSRAPSLVPEGLDRGSSQQRLAGATATRLAAITEIKAYLEAQLSELNRLRDQIRKAQLSARGSRRISHRNCKD
jgi:hypothetical protein